MVNDVPSRVLVILKKGTRGEGITAETFPLPLRLPEEAERDTFRVSDVNDVRPEKVDLLLAMGIVVIGDSGDNGPIKCFEGGLYDDGDARGGCIAGVGVNFTESEIDIEDVTEVRSEDVE